MMRVLRCAPALAVLAILPALPAGAETYDYRITVDAAVSYSARQRGDEVLVEPGPYRDGIDFLRSYREMPPFAYLALGMGADRGFSVDAAAELRREWRSDWFAPDNLIFSDKPGNPLPFENNIMTRGVLAWRNDQARLAIGRDAVHYGPELRGTLYPSRRLPYFDSARADVDLGPLRMEWYVATIQARETQSAYSLDVDPGEGFGFEEDSSPDAEPTVILSAMHRFAWDFGRLTVGVAALQVVSRRNNYFQLVDIFPVTSWHNSDVRQNNMTLMADAEWEPLDGLSLKAVSGLDEISGEGSGVSDLSGIPTIWAWAVGADYRPAPFGGAASVSAEAGYTHYLWGNYDGEATMGLDRNPLSRAAFRYLRDGGSVLVPLNSPFGPGALWLLASASYALPDSPWSLGLDATYLSKNAAASLVATPYEESGAVEDAPRTRFLSLRAKLGWETTHLRLSAAPVLLSRNGTWWAELDLTATASYNAAFRIR